MKWDSESAWTAHADAHKSYHINYFEGGKYDATCQGRSGRRLFHIVVGSFDTLEAAQRACDEDFAKGVVYTFQPDNIYERQ
jgi:hypothetical protein